MTITKVLKTSVVSVSSNFNENVIKLFYEVDIDYRIK